MGWTGCHRAAGQSDRAFFTGEFDSTRYEMLECATIDRTTFYAAMRTVETGEVWALVTLIRWARGDCNFYYKDMSDSMGPNEVACPARILDLLTPLGECRQADCTGCGICWAREWRTEARQLADRAKAASKVKVGEQVRFAREISFQNGVSWTAARFAGRNMFIGPDGYRYRLPGWRRREFEVAS